MTQQTTILQQHGSTCMIIIQPEDDMYMRMKIVDGISGETKTEWFIHKRDVSGKIAELEGDKYMVINY